MPERTRVVTWLAIVVVSMAVLFSVPAGYFVVATFMSTTCMIVAAFALGAVRRPLGRVPVSLALGVASAAILYLVFYAGGTAVDALHPFGMTSASENSIYSLVASASNPLWLQVLVLLFDSAGYEAFFRGVLQEKLQGRLGLGAAPAVALIDAGVHVITLNPIWVAGTFVTDLAWGVTYYRGSLSSSFTSHFLWDLAIFVIRPVT